MKALNSKQLLAAAAVVQQGSIPKAAAALQMSERTLRAWAATAQFRAEQRRLAAEVTQAAICDLRTILGKSTTAISDALDSKEPPTVRLQAAALLWKIIQAANLAEVEDRLNLLETAFAESA